MSAEQNPARGARVVVTLAALVIVIAGLRAAAPVLVPLLLGLFLAVLSLPLQKLLEGYGLPRPLAILATILADAAVVAVAGVVIAASLGDLAEAAPIYQMRLERFLDNILERLQGYGLAPPEWTYGELLRAEPVVIVLGGTLKGAVVFVSGTVLVLLVMVFILLEAAGFPARVRAALGPPRAERRRFDRAAREVQRYLGIKTLVSLATGLLLGGWVATLGLDFPLLWGFVGFLFHYIPNIGAFLAAVPAVLLGLIQLGPSGAALVALGYLAVNMVLGNFLEPILMGRRLGLSSLVVFLSLLFWGWLWGPIGMFLSVPLTMTAKIYLENSPELRWAAVLLGPNPPPEPAAAAPAAGADG
jgi:predicted PurR-regulated permease PerM